jgi:hypothetical protein
LRFVASDWLGNVDEALFDDVLQYLEVDLCDFIVSFVRCTLPQAVVLEGNYWRRRLESVTSEYKKWRRFFIDHPVAGQLDKYLMDQV